MNCNISIKANSVNRKIGIVRKEKKIFGKTNHKTANVLISRTFELFAILATHMETLIKTSHTKIA